MSANGSVDEEEGEPMPREENRTAEDWARYAAKKAEHAADHALDAHDAVGRLARDVGNLTGAVKELQDEVSEGFSRIDGLSIKVRKHQRSLTDLQEASEDDPADNTQVRTLKAQLRAVDKRKEFWAKFAASAVASGIAVAIGALLLRWLHL